ncbi:23545_t:CDS:1, partial [Dentiscutata erythropus]
LEAVGGARALVSSMMERQQCKDPPITLVRIIASDSSLYSYRFPFLWAISLCAKILGKFEMAQNRKERSDSD